MSRREILFNFKRLLGFTWEAPLRVVWLRRLKRLWCIVDGHNFDWWGSSFDRDRDWIHKWYKCRRCGCRFDIFEPVKVNKMPPIREEDYL